MIADGFAPARIALRYNGVDLQEFSTLPPAGAFPRGVGFAAFGTDCFIFGPHYSAQRRGHVD